MRVLLVKTSSLGDVVHTLPALTDAHALRPDIRFDWVVEEGFAEIPAWHPAVDTVIPCALRRWRKSLLSKQTGIEWREFKSKLRRQHYDLVIDAQGLLKSGLICWLVKAPKAGYDRHSIREPLASLFYHRRFKVSREQHAVERIRKLFSAGLTYPLPEQMGSCGLNRDRFSGGGAEGKLVFLHGTTREDKYWPESHWQALGERLAADGREILLPWGNDEEQQRAERLAAYLPNAKVLPRLNLQGVANVLASAAAVVSVDTGLGHLAAALGVPAVALYGATRPALVSTYGANQQHLEADGMAAISADQVYNALQSTLAEA